MLPAALARKALAAFLSVAAILIFRRYGLSPEDATSRFGYTWLETQEFLVDIIMAGFPTLLVYYQPNEIGDSLRRYWKQILVGAAILIAALAIVGIVT